MVKLKLEVYIFSVINSNKVKYMKPAGKPPFSTMKVRVSAETVGLADLCDILQQYSL